MRIIGNKFAVSEIARKRMETLSNEPCDKDFALAYSQRFADAANQIVILMFALAFAVYAVLAGSPEIRALLRLHWWWLPALLTVISFIGNNGLIYVLNLLCFHEKRIVSSVNRNDDFIDSIESAFEIRLGMLVFNTLLYVLTIWLVAGIAPPDPASLLG